MKISYACVKARHFRLVKSKTKRGIATYVAIEMRERPSNVTSNSIIYLLYMAALLTSVNFIHDTPDNQTCSIVESG
jgi:hypothetical protein